MIRIFYTLGWIMTLVGGLIMILLGIGAAFGIFAFIFYPAFALSSFFWGITIGIGGLICVLGARFVRIIGIGLFLLLIGIGASLLGAWLASWLVIIGAILGILSRL